MYNCAMTLHAKKIIIFDLDGTLTPVKCEMEHAMRGLFSRLLEEKSVAVMSGGSFEQFEKQFLQGFSLRENELRNLFLFPTNTTRFYRFDKNGWELVYAEELAHEEAEKIFDAFHRGFKDVGYAEPENPYGETIENRGSQVTLSALGQKAPRELKEAWDPDRAKRLAIAAAVKKYLPDHEVRVAGTTSIDVTRKGMDKAYGIAQIEKHLGFTKDEMLFVGDGLFPGGNDYPVLEAGVYSVAVSGPKETERLIGALTERRLL